MNQAREAGIIFKMMSACYQIRGKPVGEKTMRAVAFCLIIVGVITATAAGEVSLFDRFPYFSDTGASYVTLGSDAGNSLATLIIEEAGFRDHNAFGIFDLVGDQIRTLELFTGADDPYQSVRVSFLDGYAWIDGQKTSTITPLGTTFGFYLENTVDSDSGTFYSDAVLNGDGFDHTAILATAWHGVIVGFEDLAGGGDKDFNDLIVFVSCVTPVVTPIPAPGAMLLAGLGSALVISRRRKKR